MNQLLSIGDKAFEFSLPDQTGKIHRLSDYNGKWLVLYFYPKDDTPGCTKEACGFRDSFSSYEKKGIVVLGISKDSVGSHMKFGNKYHLPFTLLSDETHMVIEKYGAWGPKKFMGREFLGTKRITYIIDPNGKIAFVYQKVDPVTHSSEVISKIDQLNSIT